jgi:2-dehydro-3-deoxyphosphogluconate aldolase/(4S)-4-hydroxy-2-oxoglutarate aldolase
MKGAAFNSAVFDRVPIVGILRGFGRSEVLEAVAAAVTGGLANFEVTMNTPGAAGLIRDLCVQFPGQANLGAGTVCTLENLTEALDAGASFIVTPTVAPDVIRACVAAGVPVFPGAMSPAEMARAFDLGASLVKVFPSEILGPNYIRALRGPFPNWRLMPTGGVTVESLGAYLEAGAIAFGIGSPLFNRAQMAANHWNWITEQARAFVAAWEMSNALSGNRVAEK